MKILTAATMFIAIPNVFFGMFGMNVPLPFEHAGWAFIFVLMLTIFATVFIFVWARSKKIF